MKTASLVTICLMVISTKGLPDKYQSTMVRGVQDKALRQFYHELYGKKNRMEAMEKEDHNEVKRVTELNDHLESKKIKKVPEEKGKQHTVQFVTVSPTYRSSEKTEATIPNLKNEQDPTFVLSKLLFHMSQLP